MNRILVLIHIGMLLISCNSSNKQEARTVFSYNSENGITSLDPAFASSQDNIWAVNQVFNGLVQLDNQLQPIPSIAKSWQIDSFGKIYTFTLKKDVYFHDNACFPNKSRNVTAHDFAYSFKRIIDSKTASPGAWIFNDKIANNGFVAVNDTIFQIHLKQAFAPFLGMLAMPYCGVVPKEAIKKYGKSFSQNPVGTGPFTFFLWEKDVNLVLHKNPNYFEYDQGKRLPYLDAVSISFIANKQMALLQFLDQKLDLFNGITSTTKDIILNDDGNLHDKLHGYISLEKKAFLNTEYLAIQVDSVTATTPWDNVHFRRSINYAIDRKAMIRYLRNGVGNPAEGGFIPLGLQGHVSNPTYGYSYNKEKAIAELKLSDYASNPSPIVVSTTKDYLDLCIYIQKQLSEIGINCEINVLPSSEVKEQKRNGNLAFFRASWIMDYPDAENYLSCFYSKNFAPNGPNYTHFKNIDYDALYEQSLIETNDSTRIDLYRKMDQIILEDAPIVVLFYDQSIRLLNKRVQGLVNNPLNIPMLKYARIKKD
ncbi:MAG: ABC transporter substrate-binding protein [Bacteroidetes bacterium]|nr:ABC transporter substrate-binding protein [Bacteroidota bacterium]